MWMRSEHGGVAARHGYMMRRWLWKILTCSPGSASFWLLHPFGAQQGSRYLCVVGGVTLTDTGTLSMHNCIRRVLSRPMDNQYKWFIEQLMSSGAAPSLVDANGRFALTEQGRKGRRLMLASNCLSVTWDKVRNGTLKSVLFPRQFLHGHQGLQGARCGVQGGDLGHEHHQCLVFCTELRYLC